MLLAIDAGNTDTVFGLFAGEDRPQCVWRASTKGGVDAQGWYDLMASSGRSPEEAARLIRGVACASVAGAEPVQTARLFARRFLPHVGEAFLPAEACAFEGIMPILTDYPERTGVDRALNGLAAYRRFGKECIAVDVGTAVTIDVVDDEGAFLGGAIAAGPGMMAQALAEKTFALPHVALQVPVKAVGAGTEQALTSGLFYGCLGQIDEIIGRIKRERGKPDAPVIATGGAGALIAAASSRIHEYDPDLTLTGLAALFRFRMER